MTCHPLSRRDEGLWRGLASGLAPSPPLTAGATCGWGVVRARRDETTLCAAGDISTAAAADDDEAAATAADALPRSRSPPALELIGRGGGASALPTANATVRAAASPVDGLEALASSRRDDGRDAAVDEAPEVAAEVAAADGASASPPPPAARGLPPSPAAAISASARCCCRRATAAASRPWMLPAPPALGAAAIGGSGVVTGGIDESSAGRSGEVAAAATAAAAAELQALLAGVPTAMTRAFGGTASGEPPSPPPTTAPPSMTLLVAWRFSSCSRAMIAFARRLCRTTPSPLGDTIVSWIVLFAAGPFAAAACRCVVVAAAASSSASGAGGDDRRGGLTLSSVPGRGVKGATTTRWLVAGAVRCACSPSGATSYLPAALASLASAALRSASCCRYCLPLMIAAILSAAAVRSATSSFVKRPRARANAHLAPRTTARREPRSSTVPCHQEIVSFQYRSASSASSFCAHGSLKPLASR